MLTPEHSAYQEPQFRVRCIYRALPLLSSVDVTWGKSDGEDVEIQKGQQVASLPRLWMRHEVHHTERRAPIMSADAKALVDHGISLTVEESPQRVFPIGDYVEAGCQIAPAGNWTGRTMTPSSWGSRSSRTTHHCCATATCSSAMASRDSRAAPNYWRDRPHRAYTAQSRTSNACWNSWGITESTTNSLGEGILNEYK
jgi:hypothetical protein